MLYFFETDWTPPNMMAISQEFDQTYNLDEYERKIGKLIRRIYDHPDSGRVTGCPAATFSLKLPHASAWIMLRVTRK